MDVWVFKQMDVWVSHLTSCQHPLGVTAIQATVSSPGWSLEFSLLGGQISGNALEAILSAAGKWGHAEKALPECGRCSCSVKQDVVHFASQADQLASVHKMYLSFITFSFTQHWGAIPSLFQAESMPDTALLFLQFLPCFCLLPSTHREIFTSKVVWRRPFSCCLLAGPRVGICHCRSWLQSQLGMISSAPSTDFQPLDKILCESDIFTKI